MSTASSCSTLPRSDATVTPVRHDDPVKPRVAPGPVVLFAVLAMLLGGLADAAPASAITYGTPVPAPQRSAPWAVSLWWTPNAAVAPAFVCSATAVGPREVVTAAHCLQPTGFTSVEVGATTLGAGRRVAIESALRNPSYRDSRYAADVAVLRPLHSLALRAYAHLGSASLDRAVRSSRPPALGLFGWGDDQRGRLSGQLQSVTVRLEAKEARRDYGTIFTPATMLAAGRWNVRPRAWSGACNGDSGGPLVVRSSGIAFLVGVTAFGGENCAKDGPTVFTDIAAYAATIIRNGRQLPALALSHNLALPEVVTPPQVTGSTAAGSRLSCSHGTWTSNAVAYAWRWYSGSVSRGAGQHYIVRAEDEGGTLRCVVAASSHAGRRGATTTLVIPNAA